MYLLCSLFPGSHAPSFHCSWIETMNRLCLSAHTQLPVCSSQCVHVTLRCLSPTLPTIRSCRVSFVLPLPHILRSQRIHSTSLLSPCQAVSISSVHTHNSIYLSRVAFSGNNPNMSRMTKCCSIYVGITSLLLSNPLYYHLHQYSVFWLLSSRPINNGTTSKHAYSPTHFHFMCVQWRT